VLELGTLYFAAAARANHWRERAPMQGWQGPYVDRSQLYARWDAKASELKPEWQRARNVAKLAYLPTPAGTVGEWGWYSRSASVVPILRALPTWQYARG
jgi:hypothetical protein